MPKVGSNSYDSDRVFNDEIHPYLQEVVNGCLFHKTIKKNRTRAVEHGRFNKLL